MSDANETTSEMSSELIRAPGDTQGEHLVDSCSSISESDLTVLHRTWSDRLNPAWSQRFQTEQERGHVDQLPFCVAPEPFWASFVSMIACMQPGRHFDAEGREICPHTQEPNQTNQIEQATQIGTSEMN